MANKMAISSKKKSTSKKIQTSRPAKKLDAAAETWRSISKAVNKTPLIGQLIAEFVGAFLLTVAFIEMQGNPLFVGFALAGIVLVVGGVSGAHLNPGITFGAWITRRIDWVRGLAYIVVQLLGATVAFLVLNAFFHAIPTATTALSSKAPELFGAAEIVKDTNVWYLFYAELLGFAVLALGVATAIRAKGQKVVASFAAGFAILLALYISMSLTTQLLTESNVTFTFLNPAIAFAANGLKWEVWPLSIYVLAPLLGGVIGFVIQDFLHTQDESCECKECE